MGDLGTFVRYSCYFFPIFLYYLLVLWHGFCTYNNVKYHTNMKINVIKDGWYRLSATKYHRSWLIGCGDSMKTIIKEEWAYPRKRKDGYGSVTSKAVYAVYDGNVNKPDGIIPVAVYTTLKEANDYVNSQKVGGIVGFQIRRVNEDGNIEVPEGLFSFQIFRSANDAHRWMVMNGISRVHWSIGIVKSGDIENPSYIDVE